MAKAVAIRDYAKAQTLYNRRVEIGDTLGWRAATRGGLTSADFDNYVMPLTETETETESEGEVVGDQFTVAGDTYNQYEVSQDQTAPAPARTVPTPLNAGGLGRLAPVLLALASGGLGAGVTSLLMQPPAEDPPPVVGEDTDTQYDLGDVRLSDEPIR